MTQAKVQKYPPFTGGSKSFVVASQRTKDNLPHKVLARVRVYAACRLIENFLASGIYASWTGGQFWILVEYCIAGNVPFKLYKASEFRETYLIELDSCRLKRSNPEDWKEVTWK